MANEPTYPAHQVAQAARELREAAGADEERFTASQVLSMLGDEVRLLRERGFTAAQIADLLTGFDIAVSAEQVTHDTAHPHFGH